MEIRSGFTASEAGAIPQDWESRPLGDLVKHTKGFPFKAADYQTSGRRILRVSDTTSDGIKEKDYIYLDEKKAVHFQRWSLRENDLVVSTVGSKPPMYDSMVGKATLVKRKDTGTLLNQNAVILRPAKWPATTSKILHSNLQQERYLRYIETIFRGNANQASITLKDLLDYAIPLPPTKAEQEAIAEALTDADALIESLEQLLAKKRLLKQGAMQELLTGKKRLPGFSDPWAVNSFGAIAPLQRGFDLPNPQLRPGPYPVVYSNGVVTHHSMYQVRGPGVVTGRSGTIGNVTYVEENFWPHNTSLWVTSFKGNDPKFIFFLYSMANLERFATGSGVPTLNRNDVHAFRVAIPTTFAEQAAIANVLSDMDAEIGTLEAKLTKARHLKQAMMQELLTGRIRLVPSVEQSEATGSSA